MAWTLDPALPLLDGRFPLPIDAPFTKQQAQDAGIGRHALDRLTRANLLRRVVPGVYVAVQLKDDLELRVRSLSLVAPRDAVAVDETALWLHTGVLPPNGHLDAPKVSFFRCPEHTRIRQQICSGGERTLAPHDVMEVDGLRVTTQLRTALDLGRLASRDWAIASMDALLRTRTFEKARLVGDVERFRGHRGVVQLRELSPWADPRAESPGESVLRLRWIDVPSLPPPVPQVPVCTPDGREVYRIDLGVPELRFGAEYDGEEHHTDEDDRRHDAVRRADLRSRFGWHIEPVTRHNVHGLHRDVERILIEGVARARARLPNGDAASVTGRQSGWRHP